MINIDHRTLILSSTIFEGNIRATVNRSHFMFSGTTIWSLLLEIDDTFDTLKNVLRELDVGCSEAPVKQPFVARHTL